MRVSIGIPPLYTELYTVDVQASARHSLRRKQSVVWSFTMPVACMCAYMIVDPTKVKPRFFKSLLMLSDNGVMGDFAQ